ncbi:MAG: preprotein translocase subunit YajC [Campylobacterales bacterium]
MKQLIALATLTPFLLAGGEEPNVLVSLLPLIVLFGIFYLLVIRPQQKEAKRHREMVAALTKGDKIITAGGLIGEVVKAEEEYIKVKLNEEGVIVKVAKDYIARKMDETPAKSA